MENFNDSKALAIEIAKILDKKKAHDVRVLKVESLTVLTDYFVIASGTSTTQVASLADEVEFELSQKGLEPYSTEGYDSKNWVLLDYSNVIVHVFVPNTRTYYDLEHLWADGEPVDISEYLSIGIGNCVISRICNQRKNSSRCWLFKHCVHYHCLHDKT